MAAAPVPTFDRVTAYIQLIHQCLDRPSTPLQWSWSRRLETKDQPYYRTGVKVGPEAKPLDTGWVEQPGPILIINEGAAEPGTVERLEEAKLKTLHIHHDSGPPWLIPPGELMLGRHSQPDKLLVSCPGGETRYTIFVLPR